MKPQAEQSDDESHAAVAEQLHAELNDEARDQAVEIMEEIAQVIADTIFGTTQPVTDANHNPFCNAWDGLACDCGGYK